MTNVHLDTYGDRWTEGDKVELDGSGGRTSPPTVAQEPVHIVPTRCATDDSRSLWGWR